MPKIIEVLTLLMLGAFLYLVVSSVGAKADEPVCELGDTQLIIAKLDELMNMVSGSDVIINQIKMMHIIGNYDDYREALDEAR